MPKFVNKAQMRRASDEELKAFFAETTFEGIFSHEIKSSRNQDFYKGCISDIKLEGRTSSLAPLFLNVPKTSNSIPEGPCSFQCRINIEAFRGEPSRYILNLLGKSLKPITAISAPSISINSKDTKAQELFDMWGVDNCQCIGYYHYDDENDVYLVDDLRKPNFDHIPYYPGDKDKKPIKISYPNKIIGIKLNDYYLFTWKLSHRNAFNPYEIVLDFETQQPRKIDPKWFIDTLFDDRHNDKSKNFGSAANFLDTLSKQLSAKDSTFIYELLQNANDYPVEGHMVDVEFHITDNFLLFMHSGERFNVRNISGICGINEKEKTANKKTIGYKGIGFKTVFLNNHYVYLRTGNYSFRFDEGEMPEKKMGGKIRRLGAPFQILPIWTTHEEVSSEVNAVFDNAAKKIHVQIALRPEDKALLHTGRNSYEILFREVFSDSNIILFIPNINSVRVFINGKEERTCYRNNDEWIVGDYESEIDFCLQELINKTIEKGNSRIPEKYKDFEYTKVSFACKHDGAIVKPIEDATLYCYLPTRASWGFPFLMNTDMIPKGDRNDIETEVKLLDEEETNFNEHLAYIAGDKLFWWVRDLLTSRKYHLGSVFSLIPDFKKCKKEHREYTEFIECFEEAFDNCVKEETIVPVPQGISVLSHVILDTTGLSSSGIMTDEEFRKFTGMEDFYLPLPMLRKDKNFVTFLKRYAEDEQKFTFENLKELIGNEDFQVWLANQDNNDKFLSFLLENGCLKDLLDEQIFLDTNDTLHCADDLYYDIEKYLINLRAFEHHISHLSPKTKSNFNDNEKWEEAIDNAFAVFDCDNFVDSVLLSSENKADTVELLKDKDTSIHFFKFLSENVGFSDNYLSLPFFNDRDEVVDDFNNRFIFISSQRGHDVCDKEWLKGVAIEFISTDYDSKTIEYIKENFEVEDFTDEFLVENVILNDDYQGSISEAINDNIEISKDFLYYCYSQKELFKAKSLGNISLKVFDGNADEQWYIADGDVFFPSSTFDYYIKKDWIEASWMVVLDDAYFSGANNATELKKFISEAFGVEELVDKNFYENIVKQHLDEIYGHISGQNDADVTRNIDFVRYLDDNYQLIFEQKKDYDKFDDLVLVSSKTNDVDKSEDNLYIFDSELNDIISYGWFPDDLVAICHPSYGQSKALQRIGVKSYSFKDFYDDVIVARLDSINERIDSKEDSIAFHNFVIAHLSQLTDEQKTKMQGAKVYLYGQEEPADSASGHSILSSSAKDLLNLGLVEFSDLDILDPDYEPEKNSEYWGTRLENTKYTTSHFMNWLKENLESFASTLEDEDLNIAFWRWLKDNVSEKLIEETTSLPVLLKDGSIDAEGPVYFSNEYMDGAGIEHSVKIFDEDAKFLSPKYISVGDDKEEWRTFFSKANIKYDIVDILVETVIPQLSEINDENLPKLFAENRETLEKRFEDGLISHITDLRVKANDDNFYDISKTIYVDCEKEEPFPYIKLPNQISFGSAEERRLIKDIIDEINGDCVATLSEWQQRKLDCYLNMQDKDSDSLRVFHYQFINDLSTIRNSNRDTLKELERINEIQLLNKDDEFCVASSLTMGSVYNPLFDFEACGVEKLNYVSDIYSQECSEYLGKLFRDLKVHCDFQEKDIKLLEDRKRAAYFWETFLARNIASSVSAQKTILKLFRGGKFSSVTCVPTEISVKKPCELYFGKDVNEFVDRLPNYKEKIPAVADIVFEENGQKVSLFSLLPFKSEKLTLQDCFDALVCYNDQKRRPKLLSWIVAQFNKEDSKHIAIRGAYRDNFEAKWISGDNETKRIDELYALDEPNGKLSFYFGSHPKVFNTNYFPKGEDYLKACECLAIRVIHDNTADMETVHVKSNTPDMSEESLKQYLQMAVLILAGIESAPNWEPAYNAYLEEISKMKFVCCESIILRYKNDNSISTDTKRFYHQSGTDTFMYVDNYKDPRLFTDFVGELMLCLKIKADKDIVLNLLYDKKSALAEIEKRNQLKSDEKFMQFMEAYDSGISTRLMGKKADETPIEVKIEHKPIEVKDQVSETPIENESAPHDENTNNSHEQPLETESTNEKSQKENVSANDKASTESQQYTDAKTETTSKSNQQSTKSKPSYERLDPNKYKRREMKVGTQNPKTMGINKIISDKEKRQLSEILGRAMEVDTIMNENYIVRLRFYNEVVKKYGGAKMDIQEFVQNKHSVLESGSKFIHRCSARGGTLYISPSIWNLLAKDECVVCMYYGKYADDFIFIESQEELMQMIDQDAIVIQVTGNDKKNIVNKVYEDDILSELNTNGNVYTLIRTVKEDNSQLVYTSPDDIPINSYSDEDVDPDMF